MVFEDNIGNTISTLKNALENDRLKKRLRAARAKLYRGRKK